MLLIKHKKLIYSCNNLLTLPIMPEQAATVNDGPFSSQFYRETQNNKLLNNPTIGYTSF